MARLYFGFITNIRDNNACDTPNQVDMFIFRTEKGDLLKIWSKETDWDLDAEGNMYGCFKGLKYSLSDRYDNEIIAECDEDNTEEFINLFKGAEPIAFYLDNDILAEHGYSKNFIPTCKDVELFVEIGKKEFKFESKELITEEELLYNIKEIER